MSFKEAIQTCLSKYATFSGRALRSEFWFFVLFNIILSLILGVIDQVVFGFPQGSGPLSLIAALGLIVPNLAVGARRLHDIGKSGWFQLIMLIPLIGLILLIVWWCKRGEDVPNAWGPPQIPTPR